MFRSEIVIDQKSYLELVSRMSGEVEFLALTLRGQPAGGQTTLASVTLTKEEVLLLASQLQDWIKLVDQKQEG